MRDILRKVATVSQVSIDHDAQSIMVILENNQEEILIISELVKIYDNKSYSVIDITEIEVGRRIFIYYHENTPMMMSMPPKYVPQLVVVDRNEDYVDHKFAYFDEDLVSEDNTVQIGDGFLNIVESIEYRPLIKELLVNHQLLIFYKASTRSIPAIVNPEKVIIIM